MPTPTLDAVPFSPTANSYCTVAEADTYHDEHLYSTDWTGASAANKIIALIMATRQLESEWEWELYPTKTVDEGQILQWPRDGLIDIDRSSTLDNQTIPRQIKWATAELARNLLVANRTADSDIEAQGITSLSAGPISLSFKDSVKAKTMPDYVKSLIPYWWGRHRGSNLTRPVARG